MNEGDRMTDQATAAAATVKRRRRLSVPRIVIGAVTVALLIAGELLPFAVAPLEHGRSEPLSALTATTLLSHAGSERMIGTGFAGLLIVVVLLVAVLLLVMFADRVRVLLRVLGILLGIVGAIGSCVVLALTTTAMSNVGAAFGPGGPVLLLGTVTAIVLVAASGLASRGPAPAGR
ncbi:hypothetical protein [Microbacterium sp. 22242]|uniref:hypothetical protein n=1 Tax=Microbacterium sp. 22242 TaxID=3453896 RepID=UPI003F85D62E